MVYAKQPFAGPDAVLAYLSRHTHVRVSDDGSKSWDQNVWSGIVNALPLEDGL